MPWAASEETVMSSWVIPNLGGQVETQTPTEEQLLVGTPVGGERGVRQDYYGI